MKIAGKFGGIAAVGVLSLASLKIKQNIEINHKQAAKHFIEEVTEKGSVRFIELPAFFLSKSDSIVDPNGRKVLVNKNDCDDLFLITAWMLCGQSNMVSDQFLDRQTLSDVMSKLPPQLHTKSPAHFAREYFNGGYADDLFVNKVAGAHVKRDGWGNDVSTTPYVRTGSFLDPTKYFRAALRLFSSSYALNYPEISGKSDISPEHYELNIFRGWPYNPDGTYKGVLTALVHYKYLRMKFEALEFTRYKSFSAEDRPQFKLQDYVQWVKTKSGVDSDLLEYNTLKNVKLFHQGIPQFPLMERNIEEYPPLFE
jgi:hypothetical protein